MGDFKQHDQIYILAESKLNTISDRISVALNNNNKSEEEISLILSDKYNQMKEGIRGRQEWGTGLSQDETKELLRRERDESMYLARKKLLKELHKD